MFLYDISYKHGVHMIWVNVVNMEDNVRMRKKSSVDILRIATLMKDDISSCIFRMQYIFLCNVHKTHHKFFCLI